jgi:hypothetical protein
VLHLRLTTITRIDEVRYHFAPVYRAHMHRLVIDHLTNYLVSSHLFIYESFAVAQDKSSESIWDRRNRLLLAQKRGAKNAGFDSVRTATLPSRLRKLKTTTFAQVSFSTTTPIETTTPLPTLPSRPPPKKSDGKNGKSVTLQAPLVDAPTFGRNTAKQQNGSTTTGNDQNGPATIDNDQSVDPSIVLPTDLRPVFITLGNCKWIVLSSFNRNLLATTSPSPTTTTTEISRARPVNSTRSASSTKADRTPTTRTFISFKKAFTDPADSPPGKWSEPS